MIRVAPPISAPFKRFQTATADLGSIAGRRIGYKFSGGGVARDGHTIDPNGWQLAHFLENPIFLWGHDDEQPPIGRVTDIGVVQGWLRGVVEYAEADVYPFADVVFRMVKAGFINAVSTSWLPIEWKMSNDRSRPGGIDFLEQELLEISQVTLPAQADALVEARAIGATGKRRLVEEFLDLAPLSDARNPFEQIWSATKMPTASRRLWRSDSPRSTESYGRAARVLATPEWRSFGEFLQAVARAATNRPDERLQFASLERAAHGAGEVDPSAGGFAVSDQFVEELIGSAYEEAQIAPLVDWRTMSGPMAGIKVPGFDETSRVDGSRVGGTAGYWLTEGVAPPKSLPKFRAVEFAPKKLIILTQVTNELMQDAFLLAAHILEAFSVEAAFKVDSAIFSGSGAGVPLGIQNSPALLTVAKLTGQGAGTIVADNVAKMWSRMPGPSRRRAAWLVNEDAEEQLSALGDPTLYAPQGGEGGNSFPLLKGRPVHIIEQAATLGTVGDITLIDPRDYLVIGAPPRFALSVEFDFDEDQSLFRFTWRLDGKSKRAAPITPANGSAAQRSSFVTLAAR